MKRLKKATGLILLLSFSLCFISMPVLADHSWEDDPPFDNRGGNPPDPPGPRGGPVESVPGPRPEVGSVTYSEFMFEISYWLVELLGAESLCPLTDHGEPATPTEESSKAKVD